MKNRPCKAVSLVSVLWVNWNIEDWNMLLIVLRHLGELVIYIQRVLYSFSNAVTKKRSHIVVGDNPNGVTTSPCTLIDSILNQAVVGRDWRQALVPVHTKVNLMSCDGYYSCEVKVLEVKKRFVVKFVSRLPVCFILHNSSIVYNEFTSFFISLHACSILIGPFRGLPLLV